MIITNQKNEILVADKLRELNIYFSKEWKVKYLDRSYRIDFAILNNKNEPIAFIEEDGVYHEVDYVQQESDILKDSYCESVGIPIIRISANDMARVEDILKSAIENILKGGK